MASTTNLAGAIADALVAEFEAQKPLVTQAITNLEGNIETNLATVLATAVKNQHGFGALIANNIAPVFLAAAKSIIGTYGADAIYGILDTELHAAAKALGG